MDSFLKIKGLLIKQLEPLIKQFEPLFRTKDTVLSYSFTDGPTLEFVVPKELIRAYFGKHKISSFENIVMEGYEKEEFGFGSGEISMCIHTTRYNHLLITRDGCLCRVISISDDFKVDYELALYIYAEGHITFAASKKFSGNHIVNYACESYVKGVARSGEQILNEPIFLKPLVDAIKLLETART